MGDMARTLSSPANQLRILQQQFTMLTRSIGNVFMPIITQVLPYINGFVIALRRVMDMVAGWAGYEMPDYKETLLSIPEIEEEENAVSDLDKSLKKVKSSLASFDELHVISSSTQTDATGISNNGAGNPLLDQAIAEETQKYNDQISEIMDGIQNKAEQIADKITPIFSNIANGIKNVISVIDKLKPVLKGVGAAFLTAFAFKWVSGAVSRFKKMETVKKISSALGKSVEAFQKSLESTGKILPSISAGLQGFRDGLSLADKAMIGIAGSFAVFTTVKTAIYDLTTGTSDLGTTLLNISIIVGTVATAMYVALGPAGLAFTAVAAITGAVVGFNDAQNKLQQEFIEETFFDGVGIGLDNLKQAFEKSTEKISESNQRINDWGKTIEENNKNIDDAVSQIDYFSDKMSASGGKLSEEDVPKMKSAFETLKTSVKDNMEKSTQIILEVFKKGVADTAVAVGIDIDTMTSDLLLFQSLFDKEMSSLERQINPLMEKLQGEGLSESEQQELKKLLEQYQNINVSVSETSVKYDELIRAINEGKIDFKNEEDAIKYINEIKQSGKDLQAELEKAETNTLTAIREPGFTAMYTMALMILNGRRCLLILTAIR